MKLTETAMKNYQLLFANHSSRLDDTDPEFLQIFANFSFGEAMSHGQLEMKTRLMVILAALCAQCRRHPGGGQGDYLPLCALCRQRLCF